MMQKKLKLKELQDLCSESPFHGVLGLSIESIDDDSQTLVMKLPFSEEIERAPGSGQHHGGVIASLIDIAGDFAVAWQLGYGVPTINFRTDYVRPAFNTALIAHARIRRVGRSIAVCDIDVVGENGKLLAVGRGSYSTKNA